MTYPGLATSLVVATIIAAGISTAADEPLTLEIGRRFYLAPANVTITVIVEPHPTNRLLRIEADGPAMFTSTELELDGEDAARTREVVFKSLPAGPYTVTAVLLSRETQRARAVTSVQVEETGQTSTQQ